MSTGCSPHRPDRVAPARPPLRLDGASLSTRAVAAAVRAAGPPDLHLDRAALLRVEHAATLGAELSTRRVVYGRTTGVGANRAETTTPDDSAGHGLRLLRSHCGGAGERLGPELVDAALLVRLNQLLAGHSGVSGAVVATLADAVRRGARPVVHRLGAIGTGDLGPLAQIALALAGEGRWDRGPGSAAAPAAVAVNAGDALAFVSSNAVTLAEATLASASLEVVLAASHVVAALSYLALEGSPEAYADPVHRARPHPGQVRCAERMRHLLGMQRTPPRGRRIQDPFGLRAFPQVNGPALEALDVLRRVLEIEINAGAENPMIAVSAADAYHHAHFHTAYVAGALDHLRACVHGVAELSAARLGDLVEPDQTGLRAFLADGPPGSSGVMILEYVAHDALATLRQAALPVTLGSAVVSRGLEDHASFSTHAARASAEVAGAYARVLACELVAAVRALTLRGDPPPDAPVAEALAAVVDVLEPSTEDRPLADDLERATALVLDPAWAAV